jgi:hypothetical protein
MTGYNMIMDAHYHIVKVIHADHPADMHEFTLIEDGSTVLQTRYQATAVDLHAYEISDTVGWVEDCIFWEVDVHSGRTLFEWHSLNHVPVSEGIPRKDSNTGENTGRSVDSVSLVFALISIHMLT